MSPSCSSVGGLAVRATTSAAVVAAAGAALLLARWLAVRYVGLAPVRRGVALAAALLLGLVAFGLGMTGRAVALPGSVRGLVLDVLPASYVTGGGTFTVGATVLIECLAAVVSLADPRPRWSLP